VPLQDQLPLDLLNPPQPRLDNFVLGRNAEALDAVRRLLARELPERILYLWGADGSGRTHLAHAVAAGGGWTWAPNDDPQRAGVAVVDDVAALDDAAQVALFNRINTVRADAALGLLATGAAPPAQLRLREDLRTRLAWGLVYQLQPLSDAEKAAALAAQAATRGVVLSDDVLPFMLRHLPRDMRTLSHALEALDAFALARKRPLTVPLVREWLNSAQLPGM
jgi:DnaA family protein